GKAAVPQGHHFTIIDCKPLFLECKRVCHGRYLGKEGAPTEGLPSGRDVPGVTIATIGRGQPCVRSQSGGKLPPASNVISRGGPCGANSVLRFSFMHASEICISSSASVLRIRITRASSIDRVPAMASAASITSRSVSKWTGRIAPSGYPAVRQLIRVAL